MDFPKNIVLENNRVLLRPLFDTDIENLKEFVINEPEIWTYSLVCPRGELGLMSYIQQAIKAKTEQREYPFIVFDKEKKKYAGSTRFYDIQLNNQTLQLGYTWYGKEYRGTGLNRHCKYLLLQYAFEELEMERVEFRADNRNQVSIAAMKSIGCIEEGVLRSHLPNSNGGRRDSIVLSILKTAWEDTVKQKIAAQLL